MNSEPLKQNMLGLSRNLAVHTWSEARHHQAMFENRIVMYVGFQANIKQFCGIFQITAANCGKLTFRPNGTGFFRNFVLPGLHFTFLPDLYYLYLNNATDPLFYST